MNAQDLAALVKMPFAMTVIGKRRSGKSFLVNQMVEALLKSGKVYGAVLLSGTAHLTEDFPCLPPSARLPYSNEVLATLIERQEALKAQGQARDILVILDDVLSTPEAKNSPHINALYTRGRHFLLHPIVLSQANSSVVSPQIRANTDYWLVGKTVRPVYESIWTQLAGVEKLQFVALAEHLTRDFQFMCVDVCANSPQLSDWVWAVKAKAAKK